MAIVNNTSMHMGIKRSVWIPSFSCFEYPEVELLNILLTLHFIFWGAASIFHSSYIIFISPPLIYKVPISLCLHQLLSYSWWLVVLTILSPAFLDHLYIFFGVISVQLLCRFSAGLFLNRPFKVMGSHDVSLELDYHMCIWFPLQKTELFLPKWNISLRSNF